jgi:hypothetical protein
LWNHSCAVFLTTSLRHIPAKAILSSIVKTLCMHTYISMLPRSNLHPSASLARGLFLKIKMQFICVQLKHSPLFKVCTHKGLCFIDDEFNFYNLVQTAFGITN